MNQRVQSVIVVLFDVVLDVTFAVFAIILRLRHETTFTNLVAEEFDQFVIRSRQYGSDRFGPLRIAGDFA